jgi:hypothetical protein
VTRMDTAEQAASYPMRSAAPEEITVRLPFQAPMDFSETPAHLRERRVPSIEAVDEDTYTHAAAALGTGADQRHRHR